MKSPLVLSASLTVLVLFLTTAGCVPQSKYDELVRRNQAQQSQLDKFWAQQDKQKREAERWKQQYQNLRDRLNLNQERMKALEDALRGKQADLDRLASLAGQTPLPEPLNTALRDWAAKSGSDLVTFDEKTGLVRFKSDLLFDVGDDTVKDDALAKLESLSKILNSAVAEGFDIVIVGHTDDIPIRKATTRVKHPTNWHLSAHRAISVETVLAAAGLNETRIAVMGLGEFRPIADNLPNRKGNPRNRRVELYIVPAGQIRIAGQIEPTDDR